jgi:hypothetical protein
MKKKSIIAVFMLTITFLLCFCEESNSENLNAEDDKERGGCEFSDNNATPLFLEASKDEPEKKTSILLIPSKSTQTINYIYYREHSQKETPQSFLIKQLGKEGHYNGIVLDEFSQLYNEVDPKKPFTQYLLYWNSLKSKDAPSCALFINPKNVNEMVLSCQYGTNNKERYLSENMRCKGKKIGVFKNLDDKNMYEHLLFFSVS